MSGFAFQVLARDGAARRGRLATAHGGIETPAFMPVGTAATVKALSAEMVREAGAEIVLANTYHLMLRPGAERVQRLGGLHRLMRWPGPILTDSGGYQILSLASLRRIDEDGVRFRSHLDGAPVELTPERSVAVQHALDATITMVLDECTPYPIGEAEAAASMRRSMRWARRGREAFRPRDGYGLFGIAQGGVFAALRQESAAALRAIGFDGYAIGGLAVGEGQAQMLRAIEATVPHLPADRPRNLMGVGKPDDIIGAVERGIDMFDCVLPTRSGRNGQAFTWAGPVNLRNARHAEDARPLDADSPVPALRDYSRAYLHHLVKAKEILGAMVVSWHNIAFYQQLMARLRAAIAAGRLAEEAAAIRAGFAAAG